MADDDESAEELRRFIADQRLYLQNQRKDLDDTQRAQERATTEMLIKQAQIKLNKLRDPRER